MGVRKFVQMVLVTWPRWLPCSYMIKILKKSSSPEPKGWWLWNLVCSIECLSTTKFIIVWPILRQRSNLVPYAFEWEKGRTMDLSETIVVYDLKIATDDRSDKKFMFTSKLCPLGAVCPQLQGYVHLLNHEKYRIKSDFKEISLKLQQMGKVIRPFCWHQNYVLRGWSALALGLYTCIKSWKQLYKIRLQRHFFF